MSIPSIVSNDFLPISVWVDDPDKNSNIIDTSTGRKWYKAERSVLRRQGVVLVISTPIFHTVAAICNVAARLLLVIGIVFILVFFALFSEKRSFFDKSSWTWVGQNVLQIMATPVAVVGLELAALYTIFRPLDGRKLYASIERAEYGMSIAAPYFQPIEYSSERF